MSSSLWDLPDRLGCTLSFWDWAGTTHLFWKVSLALSLLLNRYLFILGHWVMSGNEEGTAELTGEAKWGSQTERSEVGSHLLSFSLASWKVDGGVATRKKMSMFRGFLETERPCAFCQNLALHTVGLRLEQLFKVATIFVQQSDMICWSWQLIWQWPVI